MDKRYGYCVCHNRYSSLNAKGLCPEGVRERHKKSAESKGFVIKENDRGIEIVTNQVDRRIQESNEQIQCEQRFNKKVKAKINRVSESKVKENTELAKIKKAKIEEFGEKCEMCEKHGSVDLFHIIGVGDKKHATNPENLLLSCRFCHLIWGANDFEKILKFNNFNDIMNRLKALDSGKYWKFRHKIEKHVIKKYFDTKDKTDLDRLGIKFVSPL
jgi:hypothetical protein